MKSYFAIIFASLILSVSANPVIGKPEPAPTSVSGTTTVPRCGGTSGLTCPTGWRCCGPFATLNGLSGPAAGFCHQGATGPCPL